LGAVLEEDRHAVVLEARSQLELARREAPGEGAQGLAADQARRARADAEVGPARERQLLRSAPVETEGVRIGKDRLVSIRGEDAEREALSRLERDAAQRRLAHDVAQDEHDRRIEPQRLLDRGGDELRIPSDRAVERRIAQ